MNEQRNKQRSQTTKITLRRRSIAVWLRTLSDVDLQAMQELVERIVAGRRAKPRRVA